MINHDLRCIFLHIPRCAGTSIEEWIAGDDWWNIDATTKHLTASQAKSVYSQHWASYFKFSVVRNPYTRTRSLLHHGEFYGVSLVGPAQELDLSQYTKNFGPDVVIEYDYRFWTEPERKIGTHHVGQIYGNILDEELDYIAKFESINEEAAFIGSILGYGVPFHSHLENSGNNVSDSHLSFSDVAIINRLYYRDFKTFGYDMR